MVSRIDRTVCEALTIALLIQIGKPKLESDLKRMYVGISYVHWGGCKILDAVEWDTLTRVEVAAKLNECGLELSLGCGDMVSRVDSSDDTRTVGETSTKALLLR